MNNTIYDNEYFIRGRSEVEFNLFDHFYEMDQSFSTTHDYKVARIIANDLIQLYLEDKLISLKHLPKAKLLDQLDLNWTESKVALIELIYALHARSVFNNGNIDIKWIAKSFEKTLNIDLRGTKTKVLLFCLHNQAKLENEISQLNKSEWSL